MAPTLTPLGGAGTVTGFKHLLEIHGQRILVDYGLFQGPRQPREGAKELWIFGQRTPFRANVEIVHGEPGERYEPT